MVKLALIAMLVSGCLFKPNKLLGNDGGGGDDDGGGSGSGGGSDAGVHSNFIPRVVGKAYFSVGTMQASPNTDETKYTINRSALDDGDLLLLIGTIDNTPIVGIPVGFSSLTTGSFGADSQTYWVFEHKVTSAAAEPPEYMSDYTVNGTTHTTSGASTILLVAIPGASPNIAAVSDAPNGCFDKSISGPCGQRPAVVAQSAGAPTSQPGSVLVYASGVDWFVEDHHSTFDIQSGFTMVDGFGDYGTADGGFTWSSLMVGYKNQDVAAAYPITGTFTSDDDRGMPWTVALPIHPDP